jgi:phage-related protein
MLDDAEYSSLMKRKAAMSKTRFGDAYEPRHVETINQLSQMNMS